MVPSLKNYHQSLHECARKFSIHVAIYVLLGIHLRLSKAKHVSVKCIGQGHKIDTTINHNVEREKRNISLTTRSYR